MAEKEPWYFSCQNLSLDVRCGVEIVGIAGIDGNGRGVNSSDYWLTKLSQELLI